VRMLDYGTERLHLAAEQEEKASWPASACGINREKGRPSKTQYVPVFDDLICKRCKAIRQPDGPPAQSPP
jgi:hypothetical protein